MRVVNAPTLGCHRRTTGEYENGGDLMRSLPEVDPTVLLTSEAFLWAARGTQ